MSRGKITFLLFIFILTVPLINQYTVSASEIIVDEKLIIESSEGIIALETLKENGIKTDIEPKNLEDKKVELDITTKKKADNLKVYLLLNNTSEKNIRLSFNTGQKYEIEIYNKRNGEKGDKVYQWSRGQLFTQAFKELKLAPEEKTEWQVNIPLSQLDLDQDYIIKAWITDRDKTGSHVEESLEF